jgi:hypothetical protein
MRSERLVGSNPQKSCGKSSSTGTTDSPADRPVAAHSHLIPRAADRSYPKKERNRASRTNLQNRSTAEILLAHCVAAPRGQFQTASPARRAKPIRSENFPRAGNFRQLTRLDCKG